MTKYLLCIFLLPFYFFTSGQQGLSTLFQSKSILISEADWQELDQNAPLLDWSTKDTILLDSISWGPIDSNLRLPEALVERLVLSKKFQANRLCGKAKLSKEESWYFIQATQNLFQAHHSFILALIRKEKQDSSILLKLTGTYKHSYIGGINRYYSDKAVFWLVKGKTASIIQWQSKQSIMDMGQIPINTSFFMVRRNENFSSIVSTASNRLVWQKWAAQPVENAEILKKRWGISELENLIKNPKTDCIKNDFILPNDCKAYQQKIKKLIQKLYTD